MNLDSDEDWPEPPAGLIRQRVANDEALQSDYATEMVRDTTLKSSGQDFDIVERSQFQVWLKP